MKNIVAFFERPAVGRMVRWLFLASLVVLVGLDFIIAKHPFFAWETIPGFYAFYGFAACAVIIAVSKLLGRFWLQKGEDYYE